MGTVTTSVAASTGRGGTGKGVAINRGRQNTGRASTVSILKTIRHKAQTAKRKAEKSTGRVIGNRRVRTKGRAGKAVGDVKHAADKIKDAFKH
jgi:uncharacterized protein YjbJ (UPF0337 family)